MHRVGRTGRAGDSDGVALSLLTEREHRFAAELVTCLVAAGQTVGEELLQLAMRVRGEDAHLHRNAGSTGDCFWHGVHGSHVLVLLGAVQCASEC